MQLQVQTHTPRGKPLLGYSARCIRMLAQVLKAQHSPHATTHTTREPCRQPKTCALHWTRHCMLHKCDSVASTYGATSLSNPTSFQAIQPLERCKACHCQLTPQPPPIPSRYPCCC
jgi:hypothetical protein